MTFSNLLCEMLHQTTARCAGLRRWPWRRPRNQHLEHRSRRPRQLLLEGLEDRTVPSTILWTNRGVTNGADNDRFNDVFGANAEAARRVADAVLRSWQNMILS